MGHNPYHQLRLFGQATQYVVDTDPRLSVSSRSTTPMKNPEDADVSLEGLVAKHLPRLTLHPLRQDAIPRIAKDSSALKAITKAVKDIPTSHTLSLADARAIGGLPERSVHLVVTSPPYWDLKKYPDHEAQLGDLHDYEVFLKELDRVWAECYRVLVPGGRLIIVVGDVCRSRRAFGAHMVVPLHGSIMEHCRHIGFHNLATVIWHKIANASFEVDNGSSFMGKPYEPNAVIKNDIEFILMQRKPGGYRRPTEAMRVLSVIGEQSQRAWFSQVITIRGASTRRHPAPFPVELAEQFIRMFSFVGDTVLDPFSGTGTTSVAAARWGRNSIGLEIEPSYHKMALQRLKEVVTDEDLPATIRHSIGLADLNGERQV